MKRTIVKGVVSRYSAEITIADIRKRFRLPEDAEVYIRVPGGGDWSNMDLEIDTDRPLRARWEKAS